MKGLFDSESGKILARYSDEPMFPIDPVAGPGQILLDIPSDIIGQAVIGINSDNSFIVSESVIADQWRSVKINRNSELVASDWSCSVTDYIVPNKSDWIVYRQALRDITVQTNPFTIVWPDIPSLSNSKVVPVAPVAPLVPLVPVAPLVPLEPVSPIEPVAPVVPVEPVEPVAPVAPIEPVEPVEPVAPVAPVEPVAPVTPVEPVAPVAPVEPVAPIAPLEPVAPIEPAVPLENSK